MSVHKTVSHEQWLEARRAHLAKEKQLTHQRDELARERRELPWERVEKDYVFDSSRGKVSLAELFGGCTQLIVYHFMFGPNWQEGCPSCSYVCDHLDGAVQHLAARDVSLAMISRAPIEKIESFKKRMGWRFPWVSSFNNEFNFDYHVSFRAADKVDGKIDYNYTRQEFPSDEAPGASVFFKDPVSGEIFHTYSTYGRGLDSFVGTYTLLDLVPRGRDEDKLAFSMEWVRHHDRYNGGGFLDPDKPYWPKFEPTLQASSSCCHGAAEAKS